MNIYKSFFYILVNKHCQRVNLFKIITVSMDKKSPFVTLYFAGTNVCVCRVFNDVYRSIKNHWFIIFQWVSVILYYNRRACGVDSCNLLNEKKKRINQSFKFWHLYCLYSNYISETLLSHFPCQRPLSKLCFKYSSKNSTLQYYTISCNLIFFVFYHSN